MASASLFVLLLLVTSATASLMTAEEESGTHTFQTASLTAEGSGTHSFQRWMAVHGRSYTAEDLPYRLSVYEQNMRRIRDFNARAAAAGRTYFLGEGPYTDLTEQEFLQLVSTRRSPPPVSSAASSSRRTRHVVTADEVAVPRSHHTHVTAADDEVAVPSSVDWRQAGAVTPVKQQGPCSSCWAFAAVAVIESLHKIQSGELLSLSEQQLLDCSGGGGCNGGFVWRAFEWVVANGGIAAEDNYPYTATTGVCDPTRLFDRAARLSGFSFVDSYNEKMLMSVVAKQPVIVSIAISGGSNIQHYKGGIYNGPCIISPADHDLTLVGYGRDQGGTTYWIGKNSWGPNWGDGGYIYIEKDVEQEPWGLCGLAVQPVYPVLWYAN